MRVEMGAPCVLVEGVAALWHLPVEGTSDYERGTLCGLRGMLFAFTNLVRDRRLCGVCLARHRDRDHVIPELGPLPRRNHRGGGRPKGTVRKMSEVQVRALHLVYVKQNLSAYELGRRVYRKLGYSSAKSCGVAMYVAFRELGLETRSVSDSLVIRNHRHGKASRERRRLEGDGEYRRWLKRELGRYRPRCTAVKGQPPGKGNPCTRPAMEGSEFCWSHDPAASERREQVCADMRDRQPRREMVAWREIRAQLTPWLLLHEFPKSRLAEATGVPHATCARLLENRRESITVELARRLLVVVEDVMQEAA